MSNALRIEELKKKFDENPRRYFAPLANEYRKAGDLQQAISICQAHLPQQPGHMSGHIVYGQALFEARQFDQARTVFETALALDPENLIALRYLGDIAFELGDRSGARGWYTRVLETDPRNEEIAALMAAMGAEERGGTSRESVPVPTAVREAPSAAEAQRSQPAAEVPAPPPSGEVSRPPFADKPAETAPPTSADAELEKLFARPAEPPPPPAPPTAAPAGFSPLAGFGGPAMSDAPPSLERPAPSLSDARSQPPVAQAATSAGEVGFVTETMAELYLKQGFPDRALGVYQQLVAQNPDDRPLRERMERVERDVRTAAGGVVASGVGAGGTGARASAQGRDATHSGRGPTVRQFLAKIGGRGVAGRGRGVAPPPGGGPRNSGEFRAQQEHATHAASGGSIDALFGGAAPSREDVAAAAALADAFKPAGTSGGAPDASIAGRPAHPAATELSLDHVFREGGSSPGARGSAPVSYDQFFSQPAQPTAPSSHGAANTVPPDAGSDDIEQFNAWLQGLKKK